MKAKYILRGIVSITMLILTSCIRDDIEMPNTPQDHQVTFSLQMPRALAAAPGTGLTEEEEREINDLTVLLFTENPSGPVLKQMFGNLTPTPVPNTGNAQYTVNTTMPHGRYRIMLLANVPPALLGAITEGDPLADIEKALVYQMPSKWDITTHAGFPMWGISSGYVVISGSYTLSDPILMLRMLARINISVADDVKDDIKLKTIRLHNPSSRGMVIPAEANLDATTTPGYIRATAPTLPLNSAGNPDPVLLTTPWEYTGGIFTTIPTAITAITRSMPWKGFTPRDATTTNMPGWKWSVPIKVNPKKPSALIFSVPWPTAPASLSAFCATIRMKSGFYP